MRLASSLLVLVVVAIRAPAQEPPSPPPRRPPNVVFVLADDLGYGELGCYGQQRIRTPRLDQLAREGTRFVQHYAGAPVCAPSRAVLLTGKHPGHAAIRDNKEVQPEGQWPLPAGEPSLARTLHDAGYHNGAFGKWGLGPLGSTGAPSAVGFDRFFGYLCQRHAHSYFPAFLYDDERRLPLANELPVPGHGKLAADTKPDDAAAYTAFVGSDYAPTRILEQALAFVRSHREQPFFLYYPSPLPHLALQVPDAEVQEYASDFAETPYRGEHGYTPHRTPRAAYAAMITHLDRDVGALLDLLDELGLANDTIVVFTSDNGATHSPVGGTDVDYFASCGPLRGRKGSLHEGGVRVPAIVRWPGHVPAGCEAKRITGFEDWLPTLAELCGAEATGGDGVSFAATLRGQPQEDRLFLYREFSGYGGWQAVWQDRWKLLRRQLQSPEKATTELYDLSADPGETKDLAAANPDVVQRLLAIAAREHVPSAAFPLSAIDAR
ncbi:MAG: arylsulfatase [Planctomycetes bacterium]|nr:arylsulfatase [Planctomycetota bacterium]